MLVKRRMRPSATGELGVSVNEGPGERGRGRRAWGRDAEPGGRPLRAALSGAGRRCASVRRRWVNVSAARGRPFPAVVRQVPLRPGPAGGAAWVGEEAERVRGLTGSPQGKEALGDHRQLLAAGLRPWARPAPAGSLRGGTWRLGAGQVGVEQAPHV